MKSVHGVGGPVVVLVCLVCLIGCGKVGAAIVQLDSPDDFISDVTTLCFDEVPGKTVVNDLYLSQGIGFSRDDGYAVPIKDWSELGRFTTSRPNVISTVKGTFEGQEVPSWSMHLNVDFSTPMTELGCYFGNDQGGYTAMTLTVYDEAMTVLGSVSVSPNDNTIVDQFIGLSSDIPFSSARLENDSTWLSVAVDDVSFGVPEPGTVSLLGLGCLALLRRKTFGRAT